MAREIEIQILRATKTQVEDFGLLPLGIGEPCLTTDTGELYIGMGTYNKNLSSGSGLTLAQHKVVDDLIHNIAENGVEEIIRTNGKVTNVIIWTDISKNKKIRETIITRTLNKVSSVVIKQYNSAGLLVATLTETISRTSGKVSQVTMVLT